MIRRFLNLITHFLIFSFEVNSLSCYQGLIHSSNPGMAKGGSGDVLAGLILSLLGQGLPARQAVPMAVWLHGEAGEVCARAIGEYGMTPTDVIAALPAVIEEHVS